MTRKVDVDALLAKDKLEITIGGKTYEVEDIPLPTFLSTTARDEGEEPDRELLHKQLAEVLGIDKKELAGVGLKATSLAINAIRDWILGEETKESEDSKESPKAKNP